VTSQAGDALTVRWRFGHALRHRVFYESTAPAWRIALHRRLATRMSACWPHDDRDAPYADLAHHRARGLQHAEAAQAYRQASLRAERRQAHHEAHSLSVEGMAQLALLPAEEQAAQADLHRVLELQHALNLILLYGAADPRAAAAAERSLERHADVAGNLDWMSACRAVLLAEHAQGRFDAAAKRSMHAVALTRSRGDLPALYSALGIHGRTLFKCGRFDEARAALNEALAIQTAHADALRSAIGHDDLSRVVRWFLVLLDQVQGRPSEPDDPSLSALLELCRSFEAPLTRIWSHLLAAMVMAWRGDAQSAGAAMRAAEREAERVERDFACNQQAMVQAWAQARGEPAAITSAWQRFEAAYALYRSSGERHLESGFFAALRSEMLIQQQRLEDAKATVVTALKEIESSGERCHLTTLERLLKTLHALQQ
jgi:tetratricopeptide (TPR) repeat protein